MAQRGGIPGTATLAEQVAAFVSTLEVRWILPGRRPEPTTDWFTRFPGTTEMRDDLYLIHPQQSGLSVKVRGSSLLELKVQQQHTSVLSVPGFATAGGRSCRKWSFPLAVADGEIPGGSSWKRVGKTRRISRFSAAGVPEVVLPPRTDRSACEAEMTDIRVDGRDWWTLAFEAVGSGEQAWAAIEAAAGALFAVPLPAGSRPRPGDADTYSGWLQSLGPFD